MIQKSLQISVDQSFTLQQNERVRVAKGRRARSAKNTENFKNYYLNNIFLFLWLKLLFYYLVSCPHIVSENFNWLYLLQLTRYTPVTEYKRTDGRTFSNRDRFVCGYGTQKGFQSIDCRQCWLINFTFEGAKKRSGILCSFCCFSLGPNPNAIRTDSASTFLAPSTFRTELPLEPLASDCKYKYSRNKYIFFIAFFLNSVPTINNTQQSLTWI